MLIRDEPPPPPPDGGRVTIEPNWHLCFWLAVAAGIWLAAAQTTGFVAFLLICATFGAICKAASEAIGYAGGLREHRQ